MAIDLEELQQAAGRFDNYRKAITRVRKNPRKSIKEKLIVAERWLPQIFLIRDAIGTKKPEHFAPAFHSVIVLDLLLHCCLRQLDLAARTKN